MSIIAVKGVRPKWSLKHVVKVLTPCIPGPFEAINFEMLKRKVKICYLRLSESVDVAKALKNINTHVLQCKVRLTAYVPQCVPDLAIAKKSTKEKHQHMMPNRISQSEILTFTHHEVFTEMQIKYPGIYNISNKLGHKFCEAIARTIFERLKVIMEVNVEETMTCFQLSMVYRKTHPHFGDFQFVLSTLHRVQDAAGVPRTQLNESDLNPTTMYPFSIKNVPYEKVQQACNKYSDRVVAKVTAHVNSLQSESNEMDSEEESARKKVREELKKMSSILPTMVRQVIIQQFLPKQMPLSRIRMYGEPFLPSEEKLAPFVNRFNPRNANRSRRMFNLLLFNVQSSQYASLMAMDGTVISGAKLVIRSADVPLYRIPITLQKEIAAVYGGGPTPVDPDLMDEDVAVNEDDNWE